MRREIFRGWLILVAFLASTLVAVAEPAESAETTWVHLWRDAPTYDFDSVIGTLNAGRNYVYCQRIGPAEEYAGYTNQWWLKTDDDSGNTNVWVSAVFVSSGGNNEPIPGVPVCDGGYGRCYGPYNTADGGTAVEYFWCSTGANPHAVRVFGTVNDIQADGVGPEVEVLTFDTEGRAHLWYGPYRDRGGWQSRPDTFETWWQYGESFCLHFNGNLNDCHPYSG